MEVYAGVLDFLRNRIPQKAKLPAIKKARVLTQRGTDQPAMIRSNPIITLIKWPVATIIKTKLAIAKNLSIFI